MLSLNRAMAWNETNVLDTKCMIHTLLVRILNMKKYHSMLRLDATKKKVAQYPFKIYFYYAPGVSGWALELNLS